MSRMLLTVTQISAFRKTVLEYYAAHGRHTLPWRTSHRAPYHVMVSEIMLQQTSVERVIPKFLEFCTVFPTVQALADASQSEVISRWVGLGYNRRAVYLHKAAKVIADIYDGVIPDRKDVLITLPGIGPYAAASIAVFAYNSPEIVIDTNIRSIYIHHFFSGKENISDQEIVPYIADTLDQEKPYIWYSALMDYGVHLKKSVGNVSRKSKHYTKQSPLSGSRRELRGAVIRTLSQQPERNEELKSKILSSHPGNKHDIDSVVADLIRENIVVQQNGILSLR